MGKIQVRLQESSKGVGLFIFKIITGFFVGTAVALIYKTVTSTGDTAMVFSIVATMLIFLRISRKWKFPGVVVFNLVCVLLAMLLRLYILVAPGA